MSTIFHEPTYHLLDKNMLLLSSSINHDKIKSLGDIYIYKLLKSCGKKIGEKKIVKLVECMSHIYIKGRWYDWCHWRKRGKLWNRWRGSRKQIGSENCWKRELKKGERKEARARFVWRMVSRVRRQIEYAIWYMKELFQVKKFVFKTRTYTPRVLRLQI